MVEASLLNKPIVRPRIVPDCYVRMAGWRYVEHSVLRMLAGWGRSACDWEDKLAVCHHVWLQAEIVERLRRRLDMFPGGKAEQPVAKVYEEVCNTILLAPSWQDFVHALGSMLTPTLVRTYEGYAAAAHPVHDKPTFELIREIMAIKTQQSHWYADFKKRYPHKIETKYAQRVEAALASVNDFSAVIECNAPFADVCGKNTEFRLIKTPGRVREWNLAPDVMPFLQVDWSRSVEARRLFFAIGYFWEMGVAESQLTWIYYADFMPWAFTYAEARHLWDESRHGDSGLARLRDFGLDVRDVGYSSYGASGAGTLEPLTPRGLYDSFYTITQIAETGYFETKRYCFEDFGNGHDDASAEMMQFDIIDETSHVEYGRIWLDEMASRAGVTEDYREKGKVDRASAQRHSDQRVAEFRDVLARGVAPAPAASSGESNIYNPASVTAAQTLLDPKAKAHYEWLLQMLRDKQPLRNRLDAPVRPNLPM